MRKHSLIAVAASLAALPAVHAQTKVVPLEAFGAEGNSAQHANWRGTRLHQVIYSSAIAAHLPASMDRLELRADGPSYSPQRDYDVTITLSSIGVPAPERASRTGFAQNLGRDAVTVLQPRRVQFPADNGQVLNPLSPAIPFDVPFQYSKPQNLLVQIEFRPAGAAEPDPWTLDAHEFARTNWGVTAQEYGAGCPTPGSWYMLNVQENRLQQMLILGYRAAAPSGAVAMLELGLSDRQIGPFPLPFDLGPFGAPGCNLYQDLVARVPVSVFAVQPGESLWLASLPLPRNFALHGLTLFQQAFAIDPQANALGVRASSGLRVRLDTPPSTWVSLLLHGDPAGPVEIAAPNKVLVLGFD